MFTGKNSSPAQENIVTDNVISETIDTTFVSFVDEMFEVLSQVDFHKVQRRCLDNLNVVGSSMDVEDKIYDSEKLSDLFKAMSRYCRPHWNWMNIRMLEKMAGNSLAAKQLIKKYKNAVYSRKVKDVLSEISNLEIPPNEYTEVKEKWNKNINELTVRDIVNQWREIEKKFNVEETMLIKSITDGCVEICWLLPNHLFKHAVCSATNNQQGRHDDDQSGSGAKELFPEVLYLKIGDVIIKDDDIGKLRTYILNKNSLAVKRLIRNSNGYK